MQKCGVTLKVFYINQQDPFSRKLCSTVNMAYLYELFPIYKTSQSEVLNPLQKNSWACVCVVKLLSILLKISCLKPQKPFRQKERIFSRPYRVILLFSFIRHLLEA